MDRLTLPMELKLAGDDGVAGRIEGYGSVFNLIDGGGDIVLPGAFKKSLADWRRRKAQVPMLWQHDSGNPVGQWTDIVEDDKGLKVTGELFIPEIPQAIIAHALMKRGQVKGLSIGFRTKQADMDRTTGARRLKELDLWEISLVTFPMMPEARVTGVKGIMTIREFEAFLRDAGGFSHALAKAVARDGFKADTEPRDEDGGEIAALVRRNIEALKKR